jgi:putative peptidoglycan lipid II flippase
MTALVTLGCVVRELVIAGWFGRGDDVDAFLIAFVIPWTALNIMGGAFGGSAIPSLIRIREHEGRDAAQRFSAQVVALCAVVLLAATLALAMAGPSLLKLFGSGFGQEKLALTRSLFYLLLPVLFLGGMGKMSAALLNAEERFAVPAIVPVIGPLTAVVAVVAGAWKWGIFALAFGATCGYLLEFLAIGLASKHYGLTVFPRWSGIDKATRRVAREYGYLVPAMLLQSAVLVTDQVLAASLSSGSVAALNYGSKLIGSLMGLGVSALDTTLPYFSLLASTGDRRSAQHTLGTYSAIALVITIPATLALIVFSEPVIRIVFQRGAFNAEDTWLVAGVQSYWALQMPFLALMALGFRALNALGKNSTLTWITLLTAIVNGILGYFLASYISVAGIALATSISYAAGMMLTYLVIRMMRSDSTVKEASPR